MKEAYEAVKKAYEAYQTNNPTAKLTIDIGNFTPMKKVTNIDDDLSAVLLTDKILTRYRKLTKERAKTSTMTFDQAITATGKATQRTTKFQVTSTTLPADVVNGIKGGFFTASAVNKFVSFYLEDDFKKLVYAKKNGKDKELFFENVYDYVQSTQ